MNSWLSNSMAAWQLVREQCCPGSLARTLSGWGVHDRQLCSPHLAIPVHLLQACCPTLKDQSDRLDLLSRVTSAVCNGPGLPNAASLAIDAYGSFISGFYSSSRWGHWGRKPSTQGVQAGRWATGPPESHTKSAVTHACSLMCTTATWTFA